ncbi:MAG: 3-oxoacyl-ACP reductase FabG [Clostridiaceae bacterium]|nr:3-oxoacyl-ACP reductase FabG [Clostridiaceae bacterium]
MKPRKHALVTGGSRGIGAAAVIALANEGFAVTFFYRKNAYLADQVVAQVRRLGRDAMAYAVDVSDFSAVSHAVKQSMLEFGAVDLLVSNAGVSDISLFTDVTPEAFNKMIDTHLVGLFNVSQAVLPGMISRKTGNIVTISSIWGMTGASCEVTYSMTKAGIIGYTKALAQELGPSGIRVNCVAPGLIDTEMNSGLTVKDLQEICDQTPLGRMGTAQEVADVIVYLASEKSSFITGQVISPNGGLIT